MTVLVRGTVALLLGAGIFSGTTDVAAQVFLQSERAGNFTPLANLPGIQNVTPIVFTSSDEGVESVTIPFTYNYLGQPFTSVKIGTNGFATFGNGTEPSYTNYAPGSASSEFNTVYMWWDDLILPAASGNADHGVMGTAPDRIFVVEIRALEHWSYSTRPEINLQLWLFEGATGRFEVHYDGTASSVENYSATVGYEGATGSSGPFDTFRPCAQASPYCDEVDFATLAGRIVAVEQAVGPELLGSVGTFERGVLPGQVAMGPVTIRNVGTDPASNVVSTLYLSTDTNLDALDTPVGTVTIATLAANDVPVTTTAMLTVPAQMPPGDYYILLEVDTPDTVAEAEETNNVAASAARFATAYEFGASAVVVPPGAAPGSPITFGLTVENSGVLYTGPLTIRVQASVDPIFDVNDPDLGTTTVTLNGVASEVVQVTVTVPALPAGIYYPLFRLDPNNAVPEIRDFDNNFVGADRFASGPNLTVLSITSDAEATAGMPLNVLTEVASTGAPFTGAVRYRLMLSEDRTLDAQDTLLGTYTVNFTGQTTIDDTRTPGFPTVLPVPHYVIAQVDPGGLIGEANESDNILADDDDVLSGPDFSIPLVDISPTEVDPTDQVFVSSSLRVDGSPYVGAVGYRVVLSEDGTLDAADTEVGRGMIVVNGVGTTAFTATVTPSNASPGRFYVFVEADPDNLIIERDEDDNENRDFTRLTIRGPNLVPSIVRAAPIAFRGRTYEIEIAIDNADDGASGPFRYAYYVTQNGLLTSGTQIFASPTTSLAANGRQTFVDRITIPAGIPIGLSQFGVVVDIDQTVAETQEADNIAIVPGNVLVSDLVPDLVARIIATATAAAAGEDLAFTRLLGNQGVADAPTFEYAYYASLDADVTTADVHFATRTSSLAEGATDYGIDVINVPATVPPGTYYIAIIVDPRGVVQEIDEGNNVSVPVVLPVYPPALTIVTDQVPDPRAGIPYEAALYAVGGTVGLSWSIREGVLPTGLTLDASSGWITGTATSEGTFAFTVRVTSGGAFAERALVMRVRTPTIDLAVASMTLPPAAAGRTYDERLLAVGGADPYRWTSVRPLPSGLTLQSDGHVVGTPNLVGDFRLTVMVEDVEGAMAVGDVMLRIIDTSQRVLITQSPLPIGALGVDYCGVEPIRFFASGGVAPYRWSLLADTPPGLAISPEGALCGTPTEVGAFPFVVGVEDGNGSVDTSLFILDVVAGDRITIATTALPDAEPNKAYEATLRALAGTEPYTWSIVIGDLPPGVAVNETGLLSGTPTEVGDFAFVVRVTDGVGASKQAPLSIRVGNNLGNGGGDGCSCASTADRSKTGWPWLLLVWPLLFLRKMRKQ